MLDIYTNLSGKYRNWSGVFDINNPRKVLFKSESIEDCYRWVLEHEPNNEPIKRQYALWRE